MFRLLASLLCFRVGRGIAVGSDRLSETLSMGHLREHHNNLCIIMRVEMSAKGIVGVWELPFYR